jgi:hypothetical protein
MGLEQFSGAHMEKGPVWVNFQEWAVKLKPRKAERFGESSPAAIPGRDVLSLHVPRSRIICGAFH